MNKIFILYLFVWVLIPSKANIAVCLLITMNGHASLSSLLWSSLWRAYVTVGRKSLVVSSKQSSYRVHFTLKNAWEELEWSHQASGRWIRVVVWAGLTVFKFRALIKPFKQNISDYDISISKHVCQLFVLLSVVAMSIHTMKDTVQHKNKNCIFY